MKITATTRLAELVRVYPWLVEEITRVDEKFRLLKTPVGKIMMQRATVAEMSKKSGMETNTLIQKIEDLIDEHA